MNILVTGATGFIGSHLTERLCTEGHNITCFVRETSNIQWIQSLPVLYKYDLEELSQYDVIYHLAGTLGQKGLPLSVYEEPHIEMTKQIISNMNAHTRLVYMSSAWVTRPKKPYELTKLKGERLLRTGDVIVRPGFIYGPRDLHHLPLYQWIKKLGRLFPIIGNGKNKVCPTYIEDVVDTLIRASKLWDIIPVAGKPITMNEFVFAIANAIGAPRPLVHLPFGPKADFFKTERVFPTAKAGATSLREGLSTTVGWYRQNNLL